MTTANTTSGRIEALGARVREGDAGAEAAFWADIDAHGGTPLIEPIDGDDDHSLVTFVWRGSEETRQVLLLSAVAAEQVSALERLPGTAVWHASCRVRNDVDPDTSSSSTRTSRTTPTPGSREWERSPHPAVWSRTR